MFERWNWKEPEHVAAFRGEAFVAVDPGEDGKGLGYEAGNPHPTFVFSPLDPRDMWRVMKAIGARVVVAEQQYVRSLKASQSVLELTFKWGMALGWLGCMRADVYETHLFGVAPASWQAHQRGHKGRPTRGEGLKIAKERARAEVGANPSFRLWWDAEVAAGREGLASALGIGDLWRATAWPA